MHEELDLKILKGIIEDKVNALTYSYKYDKELFDDDSAFFGGLVLSYIKHFRAPPTRRTLKERHAGSPDTQRVIDSTWDEIDSLDYDIKEFSFDLEELKNRFKHRAVEKIREQAASDDPDKPENPEVYFNKLSIEISRATALDLERTHTQKPIGDYIDEFQENYQAQIDNPLSSPEIKTGYSMIDSVSGGVSPGELIMVGAATAGGKALDVETPILTTNGWSTIGKIVVGDFVYDHEGKPTKVIATSGIMHNHECYKLTFSDGEVIIADKGHLWETLNASERAALIKNTDEYRAKRRLTRPSRAVKHNKPWLSEANKNRKYNFKEIKAKARTTEEIFNTIYVKDGGGIRYNHTIIATKPIEFKHQDLEIDPYVLGAWIGDGNCREGSITSNDQQIIDEISKHFKCKKRKATYSWGISGVIYPLRSLNLIRNKHIPYKYLYSSFEQRLSLLQGLMDTDGTVTNGGGCQFCTVKEDLKDDFMVLARSLGLIPIVNKGVASYVDKNGERKVTGVKFNISFRSELPAFRLQRKLDKQKRDGFKFKHRRIISCEKVESVPVQCIQVESKAHMFLCGRGLIPTHNSMLLNNLGKQIWMQDNTLENPDFCRGYSVLYFSLEMSYKECFIRFLASLANVPQRSLAKSTLDAEEKKRVNQAYDYIKQYQKNGYYFDIVDVPRNLTIEEVELRYHDAMMRYKPEIVVVDYMGLMHSKLLAKEQDWLKLGGISASLHEFGRAYDCVMITAAQLTDLNRNTQGSKEESKRVGVHRWGRSSLIMHNVNLGIQIDTRPNEPSFPDLKIHVVKNRKGPLGQASLVKNFANASLIDVPYDENEMPGDVSADIPSLIKAIQEQKNKENEG